MAIECPGFDTTLEFRSTQMEGSVPIPEVVLGAVLPVAAAGDAG
jgi:hypothetical protein